MKAIPHFLKRNLWLILVPSALMCLAYVNFFVLNDQDYQAKILIMPVIVGLILGGLIQTITQQKSELNRLNDTLSQSNRALQAQQEETRLALLRMQSLQGGALMAIGAVHDIRNILTPVMMGVDFIEVTNDDDQMLLDDIKITAERGIELTNKILSTLNEKPHTLSQHAAPKLIEEIWHRTESILPHKLNVRLDIQAGHICVDPDDLMQIIHNLSLNAYKAIGQDTQLHISGSQSEQGYTLRIKDNGPGIPKAVIDQMHTLMVRTINGKIHGLGLAIVAHIVTRNNGKLDIDSQSTGTTVSIVFPNQCVISREAG